MAEINCISEMRKERVVAVICRDALERQKISLHHTAPELPNVIAALAEYTMKIAIIDRLIVSCTAR